MNELHSSIILLSCRSTIASNGLEKASFLGNIDGNYGILHDPTLLSCTLTNDFTTDDSLDSPVYGGKKNLQVFMRCY